MVKQDDGLLRYEHDGEDEGDDADARSGKRPVRLITLIVVEQNWLAKRVPLKEEAAGVKASAFFLSVLLCCSLLIIILGLT